jgi:hypothetical protein
LSATFASGCELLEPILAGPTRSRIRAEASKPKELRRRIQFLYDAFRDHAFPGVSLESMVNPLDARTRADGFHVLHDWDGKANRLNEETIPMEVARYAMEKCASGPADTTVLALLIDYYFLYVLALLALRSWEEGDPSRNLARVTALLALLQGPSGSGHRFVDHAETLLLVAISHFEPDIRAYERLLEKAKSLDDVHTLRLALSNSAILSSHLRFGFEATYGRDVLEMRKDNEPDYPWLLFSLDALLNAFVRLADEDLDRERVVEGLLNGLLPDPRAFLGSPPPSLAPFEDQRARFCALFAEHRSRLLPELERHRPSDASYSPLSFFFNFPHNLLKGVLVDALLRSGPCRVSLDDLLTALPRNASESAARTKLATTMMGYARESPDRIRGRLVPVIVYDPRAGRRAFADALKRLSPSPA